MTKLCIVLLTVAMTLPAVAQSSSKVIFFRPKKYTGSALTPSVYLDGKDIARLDNGRYFSTALSAGKHNLASSMKAAPLEFEVKNGEALYMEMVILTGNWRGGGRFIPTPTDDAQAVIKKLKPLDHKWIYAAE